MKRLISNESLANLFAFQLTDSWNLNLLVRVLKSSLTAEIPYGLTYIFAKFQDDPSLLLRIYTTCSIC